MATLSMDAMRSSADRMRQLSDMKVRLYLKDAVLEGGIINERALNGAEYLLGIYRRIICLQNEVVAARSEDVAIRKMGELAGYYGQMASLKREQLLSVKGSSLSPTAFALRYNPWLARKISQVQGDFLPFSSTLEVRAYSFNRKRGEYAPSKQPLDFSRMDPRKDYRIYHVEGPLGESSDVGKFRIAAVPLSDKNYAEKVSQSDVLCPAAWLEGKKEFATLAVTFDMSLMGFEMRQTRLHGQLEGCRSGAAGHLKRILRKAGRDFGAFCKAFGKFAGISLLELKDESFMLSVVPRRRGRDGQMIYGINMRILLSGELSHLGVLVDTAKRQVLFTREEMHAKTGKPIVRVRNEWHALEMGR